MTILKNSFEQHNAKVTSMWLQPKLIGLEDIVGSVKEFNLFRTDGDLYRQPDNVMFDYKNKIIYNIEYKLHDHQRLKAIKQLHDSHNVLSKLFRSYDVVNLYIHDDYQIERVS